MSIAFGISLFGGVHDLLTRRIPNWFTFPAMLVGLFAQFWFLGMSGFFDGFLGILLGFGVFFPLFLFGYMGAGDIKLLMAIGSFVGWFLCFKICVASVIIGGAYALVEIIFRGRLRAVLWKTYSFLRSLFVPALVPEKLDLDKNRKFAFGFCLFLATGVVLFLKNKGQLP